MRACVLACRSLGLGLLLSSHLFRTLLHISRSIGCALQPGPGNEPHECHALSPHTPTCVGEGIWHEILHESLGCFVFRHLFVVVFFIFFCAWQARDEPR